MPTPPVTGLPVEAVLPELRRALAAGPAAVLEAPPGAGKTTLVPLHLLAEPWLAGRRILMLEPRRLAARAAAARMAELLGEAVGRDRRLRHALRPRRSAATTRIEVVTEGLLTRYLQRDPALEAYGAVIFDEFHERSLGRRSRARLVPGGAGDAAPRPAAAGHVGDAGRCRPRRASGRRAAGAQRRAAVPGPGRASGRRSDRAARAAGRARRRAGAGRRRRQRARLPARCARDPPRRGRCWRRGCRARRCFPLYGDLPRAAQDAAIRPGGPRRIVLATNIAETSLTIEGDRRGGRQRAGAAAALLGPHRDEPAGDRADRPLLGRAAQGPGRAPGAGPVPAAVVGRGGSRAAGAAPGRDRGGGPGAAGAGAGGLGRARPGRPALARPSRRRGRSPARARCCGELGALDAEGAVTRARAGHGRAAPASAACPHGADRAERTAWRHGARGGGTPRHARRRSRRCRSRPPAGRAARRRGRARIRRQLARALGEHVGEPRADQARRGPQPGLPGSAGPGPARRARAPSAWPTAAGRGSTPPTRWPAQAWLAVAELDDAGAEARIRLAAPVGQAELEELHRRPDHDGRGGAVRAARGRGGRPPCRPARGTGDARASSDARSRSALAEALCAGIRVRGPERLPWTESGAPAAGAGGPAAPARARAAGPTFRTRRCWPGWRSGSRPIWPAGGGSAISLGSTSRRSSPTG